MSDDAVSGTRERSVAKIIGKTADGAWPHDGRDITPDAWESMPIGVTLVCPACEQEYNVDEPSSCSVDWRNAAPTPDDMLAWLSAPQMHTGVEGGPDDVVITRNHYGPTVVRVINAHGNREDIVELAPTLHAALEAAVRAVAEGGAE